jgi:hypothetical protein
MIKKKNEAITVAGLEGLQGFVALRHPHYLDNLLTDGSKVVSLTLGSALLPERSSGTHLCQRLSKSQGLKD